MHIMKELLKSKSELKDQKNLSNVVDAVTLAVKDSNVKVVYNYPGRPATSIAENIKKNFADIVVQDYLPNEFVATAKGFGSSVVGCERSLVLFKDVGVNLACDLLHCINHTGINRGLIFFISDDPSAWHSQNEEDSRGIYFNAGLPILEPNDQYSAYHSVRLAYELSEIYRLPFFVRTTGRLLKESYDIENNSFSDFQIPFSENFIDIPFDAKDQWKSIFGTVERQRKELSKKQELISKYYSDCSLNKVICSGKLGIIATGFPATQLQNEKLLEGISLLKLVTLFPLPEKLIIDFMKDKERILVIDQGEPLLELLVRDCAQRNGYNNLILGKNNGFVQKVGEFRDDDLKISVNALKNNSASVIFPEHKVIAKAPALEEKNHFKLMLECLREAVKEVGCRPLYAADAGQACRVPDTPGLEDMLHMETAMGPSVSFLSGGIEAYKRGGLDIPFKGIAYIGDSDFFHSALPGICEAIAKDHPILMLLIDNQGAVSTGTQPHLGMKTEKGIQELSVRKILESLNVSSLEEASILNLKDLKEKFIYGLKNEHFSVVIVHL